jgi:trehalose/maltose hydrolase-like predicted phosphorylase
MLKALEPTQDPDWVLRHEGYSVLNESAVEPRFALGKGFLGACAARSVSRGPSWLGYIKWVSWSRCYVAGLFDVPNTEPPVPALVSVADWSRVRIVLDGELQLLRDGEFIAGFRTLDMRPGLRLAELTHRTARGITISGSELCLVSSSAPGGAIQFYHCDPEKEAQQLQSGRAVCQRAAHRRSARKGTHAKVPNLAPTASDRRKRPRCTARRTPRRTG